MSISFLVCFLFLSVCMPTKLNQKEKKGLDRKSRQGTARGSWDHRIIERFGLEGIWKLSSSLSFRLTDFLHLPFASPSAHLLSCCLSLNPYSSSMYKESLYLINPFHVQPTRPSELMSPLSSHFSPHTYFQVSSDLWAFWLCNNGRIPVPDPSPWYQSQQNLLSPVSQLRQKW